MHLVDRAFVDVKNIRQFVLDEADEMLSRGFKDQIYDVFSKLPTTTQVANHESLSYRFRLDTDLVF